MTTERKILYALAGVLLLFAAIFAYGWLKERDARNNAETEFVGVQKRIEEYRQREQENQEQLAATLKTLDSLKSAVKTPQQIVQAAPKVITLPVPVREVTPEQAAATATVEDAPKAGDLIIPQESAKAWFDAQVACKQNEAKVAACARSLDTDMEVIKAKDEQIASLQTALKGGTKWQRTKSALKWIGIGAATGAAVVAVEMNR